MKKVVVIILINIFISNNAFSEVKDCFEKVNRATFTFNQALDNVVFKPIAKGYKKLPHPIRKGTGNVLSNISNLVTIPNNILQGDLKSAGLNTARLTVNTTVGILGIFDVAEKVGLVKNYRKEDYGQTLGTWGVGEGCYLVIPILGPSTTRDLFGTVTGVLGGDPWYNITVKNDTKYFTESDYIASRAGDGVDFRAKNLDSFSNLEKNSMDFYASVRSLYIQNRKQKISNQDNITETQNDSDWDDINSN